MSRRIRTLVCIGLLLMMVSGVLQSACTVPIEEIHSVRGPEHLWFRPITTAVGLAFDTVAITCGAIGTYIDATE